MTAKEDFKVEVYDIETQIPFEHTTIGKRVYASAVEGKKFGIKASVSDLARFFRGKKNNYLVVRLKIEGKELRPNKYIKVSSFSQNSRTFQYTEVWKGEDKSSLVFKAPKFQEFMDVEDEKLHVQKNRKTSVGTVVVSFYSARECLDDDSDDSDDSNDADRYDDDDDYDDDEDDEEEAATNGSQITQSATANVSSNGSEDTQTRKVKGSSNDGKTRQVSNTAFDTKKEYDRPNICIGTEPVVLPVPKKSVVSPKKQETSVPKKSVVTPKKKETSVQLCRYRLLCKPIKVWLQTAYIVDVLSRRCAEKEARKAANADAATNATAQSSINGDDDDDEPELVDPALYKQNPLPPPIDLTELDAPTPASTAAVSDNGDGPTSSVSLAQLICGLLYRPNTASSTSSFVESSRCSSSSGSGSSGTSGSNALKRQRLSSEDQGGQIKPDPAAGALRFKSDPTAKPGPIVIDLTL